MNRYIAFLRAINVGGTTIVKMTDLKRMFESFGLKNVETYIQSGNVIFESEENKASILEKRIEHQLETAYGKRIQLFVRTTREVTAIVKDCPFDPRDGLAIYVAILAQQPDKKSVEKLMSLRSEADDFAVRGREVFNLRMDREKSVFSNNMVEKILGLAGTTRNITTIKKLAEKYSS